MKITKKTITAAIAFIAMQCAWGQATGTWNLPSKNINGLNYLLCNDTEIFEDTEGVMLDNLNCWEGELELPSSVNWDGKDYPLAYISSAGFVWCETLTRISIPETVRDVLFYAIWYGNQMLYKSPFVGCVNLEAIEVHEDNPWLCSVDGVLFNKEKTQLYNYPPGSKRSHYDIPEGVQAIGSQAFAYNTSLTTVTIPNTVNRICYAAFQGSESLEQVVFSDDGITTIEELTFQGCGKLSSIVLPESLTTLGEKVFMSCSSLKKIDLPQSVRGISSTAFLSCSLDTLIIRGHIDNINNGFLTCLSESTKLYVPTSETDRYREVFAGEVLPLERLENQEYFPEGTRWTEIRLDTLKYDTWYSKVGNEWVPNFETIEYYVKGEYGEASDNYWDAPYKCVYTNSSEWTDSLTLLISEGEVNGLPTGVLVTVIDNELDRPLWPSSYPFEWEVGTMIKFKDILSANMTAIFPPDLFDFGIVEEITEGDFGGVRPLKYSDVNGVRMIQGIGVTTWNDGECIFGPLEPYKALPFPHEESRHYRSMLVHFERNGEVLYDVWPEKVAVTEEPVTYTAGQIATIVLPTTPDASKGKYYRLDRCEDGQIIFEQELHPQAHIPYIIVPSEDFSIDTSTLDLAGLSNDTVSIEGISFIGSYSSETLNEPEGFYFDIIDTTPDCGFSTTAETGKKAYIGALRAYLQVSWDEPYNHGGSKGPMDKMEIVLKDNPNAIGQVANDKLSNGKCFDLSGRQLSRKPAHGIYIKDGKKIIR